MTLHWPESSVKQDRLQQTDNGTSANLHMQLDKSLYANDEQLRRTSHVGLD